MNEVSAASRRTTEGRVYAVTGGDWDAVAEASRSEDRLVVNFGPSHPSSHGVLRLVLELEGETVTDCRPVVGYLHTGIEKSVEFRTWNQAVAFLTRADYLSSLFTETAYCRAVERLLGIEVPRRARLIRIALMEINRVSSHLTTLGATGMELGALTVMTNALRAREKCLDVFELVTGLRMNHAYVRPGGVAQDLPDGTLEALRRWCVELRTEVAQLDRLVGGQPLWINRLKGVGWVGTDSCLALGVTGPLLRAAGLGWDLRKTDPEQGYGEFEFEVPVHDAADCWARFVVRMAEVRESIRIVEQVVTALAEPGPVMVEDAKLAWPARLQLGPDGLGNSLEHVERIMTGSMEALIHHFKLVTEGFRVPPGQCYEAVEAPRGELGVHVVSDGSSRPFRVHLREPSFVNVQVLPLLTQGQLLSDLIACVASVDAVLGGCDR